MNIKELVWHAELHQSRHERSRREILDHLRQIEPEVVERAGHPSCGLLLDAYHMERSGSGGRGFENYPAERIFAFQFSDVPNAPPSAQNRPTDRLPPGKGKVRWREVFQLLREKGYAGYLAYEAPNPESWARPPEDVAREAAQATRKLLEGID